MGVILWEAQQILTSEPVLQKKALKFACCQMFYNQSVVKKSATVSWYTVDDDDDDN